MVLGIRAQVEAHRRRIEEFHQHGRQQMLASVLLHVIEAPAPVDHARHFLFNHGSAGHMRDAAVLIDHLDDLDAAKRAGIERLAARGRIKGRPVKIDSLLLRARVHDASPEFRQIAVLIVQPIRHCNAINSWSLDCPATVKKIGTFPFASPDGMVTFTWYNPTSPGVNPAKPATVHTG